MGARAISWSRIAELPPPAAPPPLSPIPEEDHRPDLGAEGFCVFFGLLFVGLLVWMQLERRGPSPSPQASNQETAVEIF